MRARLPLTRQALALLLVCGLAPAAAQAQASAAALASTQGLAGAAQVSPLAALAEPLKCPVQARIPSPTAALSLEDALFAAVCRSGRQRQTQGLSLQAQANVDRARALLRPQLSLSAGGGQTRGSPAQADVAVRLDWVLIDFGNASATQRAAREAWLAVLRDRDADLLLAVAQASDAYVAALAAYGRMEAAAQNLQAAQDNQRVAQARAGAGAATVTDRLQAETAAGQARVELGRARTQWRLARGELAAAMDLPVTTEMMLASIDLAEGLFQTRDLDIDALIAEARERHPSVLAARARRGQSLAESAAVRAERWGAVSLSARAGNDRIGNGSGSTNTSASLQWQLPLTDGGTQRARELDARGQGLVSDPRRDYPLLCSPLQVWQAGQTLDGERRSVQASHLVLDTAVQAMRAATERFRMGVGSFSDVNAAYSAVASSRLQWVDSRANVLRAQLQLAAATGRFGGL
jgi:outer membrane protein